MTVGVFKQLAVKRRDTGEHPLFVGPMFLHGNSDFETYHVFFLNLSAKLNGTPSSPVFGSDEEKAMKQAIKKAFPTASSLSCTRHLQQNVDRHIKDKIGMSKGP